MDVSQGLLQIYKCRRSLTQLCTTASTWLQRLAMMWTLLNSLLLTALLTACHASSQPSVQLGNTTLIGSSLQPANLEFFGGYCYLILMRDLPHPSLSGIPYVEPPIDGLRFSPPQLKYSLAPLQSFDASNFGNPCPQPVSHPRISSV